MSHRTITLIGTNGATLNLTSETYMAEPPDVTLGSPNLDIVVTRTALGRRVQTVRHDRIVTQFVVNVMADTDHDLDHAREMLIDALVGGTGKLMLIVGRSDGGGHGRRAIQGRCVTDDFGPIPVSNTTWAPVNVAIESVEEPWWVSLEAEEVATSIGVGATTPWVGQMPIGANVPIGWPWHIGGYYIADAAAQTLTLTNPGPLATWPEWTITGPATSIELAHERTGRVWSWSGTMIAGETMRIITDPRAGRTVEIDATPAWAGVAVDALMSKLEPGSNRVQLRLAGGVDPDTTVTAVYYIRHTAP